MANIGRPRALDEVKRREVCALVSAGCGIPRAAEYVGCNASTIRREALRNADFHEDLRRAELASELEPLRLLRQKANTHWRAAAWLLERFNPDRYARQRAEHLTLDQVYAVIENFVDLVVEEIPDEELQRKVFQSIGAGLKKFAREAFAKYSIRRDPHGRKRRKS
jgi:IS30 family transposase